MTQSLIWSMSIGLLVGVLVVITGEYVTIPILHLVVGG